VLAVGRAEVLEDEGATESVNSAADVTGEELADHSSSKRPLSSSSRSNCGTQENALMFVSFADTCLSPLQANLGLLQTSGLRPPCLMNKH